MNYKIENPIVIGSITWQLLSEIEKANIHQFADKYSTVIDITNRDIYYLPHYISDPYNSMVLTTNIYEEFRKCFDYKKLRHNIEVDREVMIDKLDDISIRDKIVYILESEYGYKIFKKGETYV